MKTEIRADLSELSSGVDFIGSALRKKKVSKKETAKSIVMAEDVLARMIEAAGNSDEKIRIETGGAFGNVYVRMHANGEAFGIDEIENKMYFIEQDQDDVEANNVIKRLIDNLFRDSLSVKNERGINKVKMGVHRSPYATLIVTLLALVLGIGVGFLMQKFVPSDISGFISKNIFSSVYDVFMSALKLIVGPLVFFSVASSIADFSDLRALGRIAIKIVAMYLLTSMIAIAVGFFTYQVFPIGDTSLVNAVDADAAADTIAKGEGADLSIRDTLVNIVPSDFVTPFQESDMLQIIFMAVVIGLAAAAISVKKPGIKQGLSSMNMLVSKLTSIIVTFIPLIVFCSMAKMMINMDLGDLAGVIKWIPVIYVGDILMILVYGIILLLFTRLNPITFFRKYFPAMISAFTLSSSNAALPTSVKMCDNIGVANRVYSFSLPLGATINMDGSCITLIISALFFARIYGINVTSGVIFSLALSIMLLSVGSPGVPGGNLVCIALIIPQIGIPAEAISLILGLYPIVSMMQTCVNVTGDATVTTVVAKHEKLLDLEKFNSK
ncbi:MAG: dicarboxylate/amino acid:cation symporter [Eubacterium sp.]|nr:dicarboxylate/amino acid:cation symporter [Eubacterium sp.]